MATANNPSAHSFCHCDAALVDQRLLEIAKFMREDPDNVVFRRFETLHLLNILSLQHELTDCYESISVCARSGGYGRLRESFLNMRPLLENYGKALAAYEQIRERHRTPAYVKRALEAKAQEKAFALALELNPLDGWSDLMSLGASKKGVIHRFVDASPKLQRLYHWVRTFKVFRGTGQDNSETGPGTAWISQRESGFFYYSERAVRFTEEVVITFILLCISTLPVVALSLISGKTAKLITIVACVVVLAPLVSVFMPEKVQRSNLTLMLAYAAVLVVFLNGSKEEA